MRDKMTKIRAVLFIYLTFQAGIAQALQLKDLIAEVVENNLEIQKMQYELESEHQSLLSSQHLPHTSLDLYGGAGAQRNYDYTSISDKDLDKYSAGIVLTHKLFDGHYADSEIDRHKASFSAKSFLLESEAENITLDTIELFLEILKLDQISNLSTEFLGQLNLIIELSNKKLNSGVLNTTDHALVLLAYDIARNNEINAFNNLKAKISLYEKIVGSSPPISMMKYEDIEVDELPESLSIALEMANQNHPVLFACKEHIKEAKAQYDGSFSKDYPGVEFELSADWHKNMKNTQKRERTVSAMININYNLLGSNNNAHFNDQYRYLVSEAEANCKIKEREVISSMKLSFNALALLQLSQRYINEAKNKSTSITESYIERSEVETISLEKLIQRSNQKLETEIMEIETQYDLLFTKFRVLHSMGSLLKHFGITEYHDHVHNR